MATQYPQLKVEKREVIGRKVKHLRKKGLLPANLYGQGIKSQTLQLSQQEFLKVFDKVGETGLVSLTIKGEKTPHLVLIQHLQREPVEHTLLHVDFRQVDLKQKIKATIPIEMIGEAPAVAAGGILVQLLDEVEVEALPTDLPEKITVKIDKLAKIGDSLTLADLNYDKTKIQLKSEDLKALVVKIEAPVKEEVEVKPAAEEAAVKTEEVKKGEAEKKLSEESVVSEKTSGTTPAVKEKTES